MKDKNEFSEIERELFEHFEKKRKTDIPLSTQYTIQNAFNKKQTKRIKKSIPQIIMYIFSILVLTTGVVFAKDIVNMITSIFNNSTKSIDTAVENGYVQNVDMDFVYDNDIGIKVDYIMMNNSNLDISYVYSCNSGTIMDYIELNRYSIKDDRGNWLYQYDSENSSIENPLSVTSMKKYNDPIKLEEGILRQSILYTSDNFPPSKVLLINIDSLKINNEIVINGNWNFEITLDDKFIQRDNIIYQPVLNEHIIQSEITLSETTLKIFLELDLKCNDEVIFNNEPILKNELGEIYECIDYNCGNLENTSIYDLEFNVNKYSENIDTLYLNLKIDTDKNYTFTIKY